MPSRPATLTQAETARVIRAAKKEGATAVEIHTDGTIVIQLLEQPKSTDGTKPVAKKREIVL